MGSSSGVLSGASIEYFLELFLARESKQDILGASCVEPSEARLRAADESTISLLVSSVSKEIEDASDLQVRACF